MNIRMVAAAMAASIVLSAGYARADEASPVKPVALPSRKTPEAPPAELLNLKIAGAALNVIDLEAMRKWYETIFNFKVSAAYERDGAIFEYVLTSPQGGALLVLTNFGTRPPGFNSFSRIVLQVPDAKALSENLYAHGVPMSLTTPGVAYMATDPEGNILELYTPRKP